MSDIFHDSNYDDITYYSTGFTHCARTHVDSQQVASSNIMPHFVIFLGYMGQTEGEEKALLASYAFVSYISQSRIYPRTSPTPLPLMF